MSDKTQILKLKGISAEASELLPKKAIRVIYDNLEDINIDATIDLRTARKVRKEILEIIENAALGYCGKYKQVPTAYLSARLLQEAEVLEENEQLGNLERYGLVSYLENLGDPLREVRGSRIK